MTSSRQTTSNNNNSRLDSDNDARDNDSAYRLALLSLLTATDNTIEDDRSPRNSTKRTNMVRQQARPRSALRSRPGSRVPPSKCQDPSDMFGLITSLLEAPSLDDIVELAEEDLSSMTDQQDLSSIDALVDMYMPGLPEDEMDYYRRRSCPFMRTNDDDVDGK